MKRKKNSQFWNHETETEHEQQTTKCFRWWWWIWWRWFLIDGLIMLFFDDGEQRWSRMRWIWWCWWSGDSKMGFFLFSMVMEKMKSKKMIVKLMCGRWDSGSPFIVRLMGWWLMILPWVQGRLWWWVNCGLKWLRWSKEILGKWER